MVSLLQPVYKKLTFFCICKKFIDYLRNCVISNSIVYNIFMKLDGTEIAKNIYTNLKNKIETLKKKNIIPHLVVFLVGENPASIAYVTLKQKRGEEIGCKVTILRYETDVTTDELTEKIKLLNDDPFVHGILIQRPLPDHINVDKLVSTTDPKKDIDGFHSESPFILPLPLAVGEILKYIFTHTDDNSVTKKKQQKINYSITKNSENQDFIAWLTSKKIVIIGKGQTGGGPVISYLKKLDVTPIVIDSKTINPELITQQADILISATGSKNSVKAENIKKGVILISVGINRDSTNKLHGDYDETSIRSKAQYYTPTPGGVGPVNVAMLINNLLDATVNQTININ